jgi:hypothetical protein
MISRRLRRLALRPWSLDRHPLQSRRLLRRASSGGVWIERSERTTKTDDLNALSDAELAAIVRQGVQDPESKKMNWPQH